VAEHDPNDAVASGAFAIALDPGGNVIVGQGVAFAQTQPEFGVVKLDPSGMLIWALRLRAPGSFVSQPWAMAVDGKGATYMTGSASLADPFRDEYFTTKVDAQGRLAWIATSTKPLLDAGRAIALDSAGHVCVAGTSGVVKYDGNGKAVWVRYLSATASVPTMALDSAGHVYVTGSGERELWVIKLHGATGRLLWSASHDGTGGAFNQRNEAWGVAVDPSNNVYLVGYSGPSGVGNEIVTLKYSQTIVERRTDGAFGFQAPASPGEIRRVQASTGLRLWEDLAIAVADPTGILRFEDPAAAGLPQRFYRVLPAP
jgi:hypothetical protein